MDEDPKALIRRLEESDQDWWRRKYAAALGPQPRPMPTPGCTCSWEHVTAFGRADPVASYLTEYHPECPDHTPPEIIP